jgi:hypothetical protein
MFKVCGHRANFLARPEKLMKRATFLPDFAWSLLLYSGMTAMVSPFKVKPWPE